MAFKLNHFHLKSRDPRKTAQWYVDNLDAKIVRELGPTGFRLDLHGVTVNVTGIVEGQNHEQHYGLEHVAIDTDDLPGTVEKLEANGARVLEEMTVADGRKVFFIEDPDGVLLELQKIRE